ncbi:hypothetical protein POREN0001_0887 [Porphyromonas endodontalis ATCC 35406]|uniref:Uncharacterized protein n=1 Tax=Porphyromonas endodontalis (strain ATCC 35406 / DSM 24491 / JCM 8526 / CCUG 16442 / BCRC 14492 / NCTC 13058 / HG 370) TaxID=553175 RepID=C3J9W5_POREA|nr:hypothetical protein POREN0001_0887 [Porphyromonas endodontalis ATCC 35406]
MGEENPAKGRPSSPKQRPDAMGAIRSPPLLSTASPIPFLDIG